MLYFIRKLNAGAALRAISPDEIDLFRRRSASCGKVGLSYEKAFWCLSKPLCFCTAVFMWHAPGSFFSRRFWVSVAAPPPCAVGVRYINVPGIAFSAMTACRSMINTLVLFRLRRRILLSPSLIVSSTDFPCEFPDQASDCGSRAGSWLAAQVRRSFPIVPDTRLEPPAPKTTVAAGRSPRKMLSRNDSPDIPFCVLAVNPSSGLRATAARLLRAAQRPFLPGHVAWARF